jgi:pimeloyl-ACP methyl ester carboxylesterase
VTAPGLRCDRLGDGPPVVLVHGVGVGPWSYVRLATDLARDHEVVVAHRRGYGSSAEMTAAASLDEQVADLVALAGGRAAFVGVSGGATLVLALALAAPELVAAAVVHEPVVGPLAPDLHGELRAAADRLAAADGEPAALAFVRALVGEETWAGLDAAQVADVALRADAVRAEVPHFLAFAPEPAQLAALAGLAFVSSAGARSRNSRHLAAAAVSSYTSTSRSLLSGVGHLAQLDDPAALARVLRGAETLALQGGADGDDQVLTTGRGDHLQPDG